MSNLRYQLKGMMKSNKDGSYGTQAERSKILLLCAEELKSGGYRLHSPSSLKPKHVDYLVNKWTQKELSVGTIKNRMSHLRWWADKVGKASMLPKSNSGSNQGIRLDIDKRSYVPTETKAKELEQDKLNKITDEYVKLSLQLQREFGLRREEAIKFRPDYAIREDKLVLMGSWTKGGRPRDIPIRTDSQRQLLSEVSQYVGKGSLIRSDRSYIQQLKVYEYQTANAGLDKNHGLRHQYAQERYAELAGWKAPLAGGPTSKQLTPEGKKEDERVRLIITEELGHSRLQITVQYLGR